MIITVRASFLIMNAPFFSVREFRPNTGRMISMGPKMDFDCYSRVAERRKVCEMSIVRAGNIRLETGKDDNPVTGALLTVRASLTTGPV
jgi:hypothetical protein